MNLNNEAVDQSSKLKSDTSKSHKADSNYEISDSLNSSEILIMKEEQRNQLKRIFMGWRIQAIKRYDIGKVATYILEKEKQKLMLLFHIWHNYTEQLQIQQVSLYRHQIKWITKKKKSIFKAWTSIITYFQTKNLKNYKIDKFHKKSMKKKIFLFLLKFMRKCQNQIVASQDLQILQRERLLGKYFNLMLSKLHQTENFLKLYQNQKQISKLKQLFEFWFNYTHKCKMDIQSIINFRKNIQYYQLQEIFNFIKQKAEKNYIYRRQKKLAEYGRWRYLMRKSLYILFKYKERQQNKRYLLCQNQQKALKLILLVIRQTLILNKKFKQIKEELRIKELKRIFYNLQTYSQKQKYKKYSLQCAQLLRRKQLQRSLLQILNLYHQYQVKKREMNDKMQFVHLCKLGKNVLKYWRQYNQITHYTNQLSRQITYSHEFRIKKQIFDRMK